MKVSLLQSNFFNPNKMISSRSQKLVFGILYFAMAILGSSALGYSSGLLTDGILVLNLIILSFFTIVICIGIWWHEVSKDRRTD